MHDLESPTGAGRQAVDPALRRFFAEELRAQAAMAEGEATERVLAAFRAVPREDHAGPGPWLLHAPLSGMSRRTPDADPAHLYHNVLIALDEGRGINVGEPSLWAGLLARVGIEPGMHVLQVGAGSGYYTAIIAELVGSDGRVLATEIEPALAAMAARALAARTNVALRRINGATGLAESDGPFDLIVVFAGVTHVPAAWMACLPEGGRILAPLTGGRGWGAMVLATKRGAGLDCETLSPAGFVGCEGAREDAEARRLDDLWLDASRKRGWRFRAEIGPDGAVRPG